MRIYNQTLETPIGQLEVTASSDAILSVYFIEHHQKISANELTSRAVHQLREYFDGSRLVFDVPTTASGTEFQMKVWAQLNLIEYGSTRSYQDIAFSLSNPKAVRAVGSANGRNPLSIIVPCHRVIGANGNLSGYAGGVARKEWLLRHEGAI